MACEAISWERAPTIIMEIVEGEITERHTTVDGTNDPTVQWNYDLTL